MPAQLPEPSGLAARLKEIAARAYFAFIKLPLILVLIVFGFGFEFIIQLPYWLRLTGDGRRRVKGASTAYKL
jgi:hypothetical protein